MPSQVPFFKGYRHPKTYADGQCHLWNSGSGANKAWVKKMRREMNISFALLEPHPLPTTSQLFRSPGLPQTRRVSLPWPEAVAGTWKARNSRSSGVSGTASALRWSWHRFLFSGARGDVATSLPHRLPWRAHLPARRVDEEQPTLPRSVLNDLPESKI